MAELVVRLVFSLAIVLGMVLLIAKASSKRFRGPADALVRVLHRQPISRGSAVTVVTVGSRVLVLGTTEQQVQILAELDPQEVEELLEPPGAVRGDLVSLDGARAKHAGDAGEASEELPEELSEDVVRQLHTAARRTPAATRRATKAPAHAAGRHARVNESPLAGSALSAQTWKQAFSAATGRLEDAS